MISVWSSEEGQSLHLHDKEDSEDSKKVVITSEELSGLGIDESNYKDYCLVVEERSKEDYKPLYTCVHYNEDNEEMAYGSDAYIAKDTSRCEKYSLEDIDFDKFMSHGIIIYGQPTTYLYSVRFQRTNVTYYTGEHTMPEDLGSDAAWVMPKNIKGTEISNEDDIIEIQVELGDNIDATTAQVILTSHTPSYGGWAQICSGEGTLTIHTTVKEILKSNNWTSVDEWGGTRFTVSGLNSGDTFSYSIKIIAAE